MSPEKEKASRWRGFFCIYPSKFRISDGDRKSANFVGWEVVWNVGRHFGKSSKKLDRKTRNEKVKGWEMCKNPAMEQVAVIAKLREHAPELNAAGLRHVRVFGSTARGESTERSDVDLLVEFDPAKPQTLVSVGHLRSRLEEILQTSVDVSAVEWMREPVRSRVMSEAVLAF